jgi:Na+-transporting NADH:ubiquinone oxidoreductase subunit NqrB
MPADLDPTALGVVAVLLFVGAFAIFLAWTGRTYWRQMKRTQNGIVTTATIDDLQYTGTYLLGRFFALVSFRDSEGTTRHAKIPLPSQSWNRLRNGAAVTITYAPADPQSVCLGGKGLRRLFQTAGVIFMTLGSALALGMAYLLVCGLNGWADVQPIRLVRSHHGVSLPPPAERSRP